jgi:hypothetical protein
VIAASFGKIPRTSPAFDLAVEALERVGWPEESRKSVKLGTIAIAAVEPDATCDTATFDPVVRPT